MELVDTFQFLLKSDNSKSPLYVNSYTHSESQISLKSVQQSSTCYMDTDRHNKAKLAQDRSFLRAPGHYRSHINTGGTWTWTVSAHTRANLINILVYLNVKKRTPWLWSASELCRPSDRRFLAKYQLLRIEDVAWSAQRIPPVVFSVFLTGAATVSSK
jgi:hypothetical protein